MTPARHSLRWLAGLSPALLAAPTLACPKRDQYLNPGLYVSLHLGQGKNITGPLVGFGAEVSWNCMDLGESALWGGLVQAEVNLEGRPRFALAGQGALPTPIPIVEAGLAYTGGDDALSGLGAHTAASISLAVFWMGLRFTFGGDAWYMDALVGAKYPTRREGELFNFPSGRPVRQDGQAVQAALLAGDPTGDPAGAWHPIELEALPPLARAWARDALAEHASVLAFRKLAAELAALGAGPHLLARLLGAATEERRHAADAFALASRHLGRPLAAGPVPCPPTEADPEALRARLIAEAFGDGLIGEAAAAHRAEVAAAHATCPQARAAQRRVAHDEAQHAALAGAILAECLRTGGSAARDALADAARAAHPDPEAPEPVGPHLGARFAAHGQATAAPDARWIRGARRHAERLLRAA